MGALFKTFLCIAVVLLNTSCGAMLWPWSELWEGKNKPGEESYSPDTPAIEATETYYIALGGVAPGRDELVLTDDSGNLTNLSGSSLRFKSDTDMVGFLPRPGYDDFASGSGALIVPQKPGFAVATYYIDGILQGDQFLIIVPPQSLIQIMVAEAGAQLTSEAEVNSDFHVELTSESPTANGVGSVTRNRISLILPGLNFSLFGVNELEWFFAPPSSYFDAVITAKTGGVYQYSPVDPDNETYDTYTDAEARGFLDPSYHRAYDQAVITAAGIFSDTIGDTTNGSFGFFSPTEDEWKKILLAYNNSMINLPNGCGRSNDDFPSLDPIQLVIINDIWTYSDGRPSFVFIRSRESNDYAVIRY